MKLQWERDLGAAVSANSTKDKLRQSGHSRIDSVNQPSGLSRNAPSNSRDELGEATLLQIPSPPVETHVGADIRSLRKTRGLTLSDLCDALGRSVGWLSQVERGQADPSIPDLKSIAALFRVPVSFFFRHEDAPENERGWIVRAGARAAMGSAEDGLTEELLSPDISGEFEMIRSVFAPGSKRDLMPARDTQDGGYVISGELEMTIGDQVYVLCKGDSFQFNRQPYGWRNTTNEAAEVIWIISPPIY